MVTLPGSYTLALTVIQRRVRCACWMRCLLHVQPLDCLTGLHLAVLLDIMHAFLNLSSHYLQLAMRWELSAVYKCSFLVIPS